MKESEKPRRWKGKKQQISIAMLQRKKAKKTSKGRPGNNYVVITKRVIVNELVVSKTTETPIADDKRQVKMSRKKVDG